MTNTYKQEINFKYNQYKPTKYMKQLVNLANVVWVNCLMDEYQYPEEAISQFDLGIKICSGEEWFKDENYQELREDIYTDIDEYLQKGKQ